MFYLHIWRNFSLKKINYVKISLDLLMALTFALLFKPRILDGLPFHETAGLVIGVAVLSHILLNWRWVKNATLKIFNPKLPGKIRFSYLLNLLLLITMSTIIITGIFISRVLFPNLAVRNQHSMRALHNLSSYFTLMLVGIHVGIHWQWVMNVWKKMSKFEKGKPKKGFIVTGVVVLLILISGYQISSSDILTRIVGSEGSHSQQLLFQKDGHRFDSTQAGENQNGALGISPNQSENGKTANSFQGRTNRNFDDGFRNREDFRGRGGQSAIIAIIPILGLMGVIIFITYYGEKNILRKKR
jgi:hypothetical protein